MKVNSRVYNSEAHLSERVSRRTDIYKSKKHWQVWRKHCQVHVWRTTNNKLRSTDRVQKFEEGTCNSVGIGMMKTTQQKIWKSTQEFTTVNECQEQQTFTSENTLAKRTYYKSVIMNTTQRKSITMKLQKHVSWKSLMNSVRKTTNVHASSSNVYNLPIGLNPATSQWLKPMFWEVEKGEEECMGTVVVSQS